MIPTVAIVNRSTLILDAAIALALPALQRQVSEHLAPYWGVDARIISTKTPVKSDWQLVLVDEPTEDGAYGWHEVKNNQPWGVLFARLELAENGEWTDGASHEILEMLADPYIGYVRVKGRKGYALEVADPCQDSRWSYRLDGVLVSDFVTPAWFGLTKGPPYDFRKHCRKPWEVLKGGYAPQQNLRGLKAAWQVLNGNGRLFQGLVPPGSRRWRRMRGIA